MGSDSSVFWDYARWKGGHSSTDGLCHSTATVCFWQDSCSKPSRPPRMELRDRTQGWLPFDGGCWCHLHLRSLQQCIFPQYVHLLHNCIWVTEATFVSRSSENIPSIEVHLLSLTKTKMATAQARWNSFYLCITAISWHSNYVSINLVCLYTHTHAYLQLELNPMHQFTPPFIKYFWGDTQH